LANTAVVYDRRIDDKLLSFEASGALKNAALILRDRETDSWWSIMTSDAIGGIFEGAALVELPAGEKTTWEEWRNRHPETLVLSVDGEEHIDNNPYDNYFRSEGTFRDLAIDDTRLEPKASVYSFWFAGEPWAVAHDAYRGGRVFVLEGVEDRALLLYRTSTGPIYESSRAFLVTSELATRYSAAELLSMAEAGESGIEAVPGFDTFWYTWAATNRNTRLIQ
jgi:hypothetical protein